MIDESDRDKELRQLTADSKARTAAMRIQIVSVKAQTQSIRAKTLDLYDKRSDLDAHISLLSNLLPPKCPERRLAPNLAAIPCPWLTEGPTEQDSHLRSLLDGLTHRESIQEPGYMPSFRAFDSIYDAGFFAFERLRMGDFRRSERGALVSAARQLEEVWDAIQWRSTTKAEDEAICLDTLLDLDMSALLAVPESRRMLKFASMLEYVPAVVAFLGCARLTD